MIDPKKLRLGDRLYMNYLGTKKEIEVKGIFPDKIFFEDYWKDGETFCKPESLFYKEDSHALYYKKEAPIF